MLTAWCCRCLWGAAMGDADGTTAVGRPAACADHHQEDACWHPIEVAQQCLQTIQSKCLFPNKPIFKERLSVKDRKRSTHIHLLSMWLLLGARLLIQRTSVCSPTILVSGNCCFTSPTGWQIRWLLSYSDFGDKILQCSCCLLVLFHSVRSVGFGEQVRLLDCG